MAASVRIEDEAFSDERYGVLATVCLLADADHARGKMARIWRQCTMQNAHVLPVSVVVSVLGQNAVDGLVEARLGVVADGGIRIKGTRGRIEWLSKLRKNAAKGGAAKSAKRHSGGKQEAAKSVPPAFPPAPAPAPAHPDPDSGLDQEHRAEVIAPAAPGQAAKRAAQLPDSWIPDRSPANVAAEAAAMARGVDLREELLVMRDWAVAGGRTAKDWNARWRNWTRKATPTNGARAGPRPRATSDAQGRLDEQLERVARLEAEEREQTGHPP